MQIIHNLDKQQFETTLDGHTAYLSYDIVDDHTLNYNHTIVPKALGGRGIGTALVEFALKYANDNNKSVVPSCSFVAHYLTKNKLQKTTNLKPNLC